MAKRPPNVLMGFAMLLVAAACSSGESVAPPTTTSAATTTTASTTTAPASETTTTTAIPPTTTTEPAAAVTAPEQASTGRVVEQYDIVVSAPDRIDDPVSIEIVYEFALPDRSRSVVTWTRSNFSFGDIELIEVGYRSWEREHGKPWQVVGPNDDGWWRGSEGGIPAGKLTEERGVLYSVLSKMPWDVVTRNGVEARRYVFEPEDAPMAASLLGITPAAGRVTSGSAEVYLRTSDDALIAYDLELTGRPGVLGNPVGTFPTDATLHLKIEADVELGDAANVVIEIPDVPDISAPDGFLPYRSESFGFETVFPEAWIVLDEPEVLGSYTTAATFLDWDTGTDLVVGVEELGYLGGLTLDEYIDISISYAESVATTFEVLSRTEAVTAEGRTGRVLQYRATMLGMEIESHQLVVFVGSEAYILAYSTLGDTPVDGDVVDVIFANASFSGTRGEIHL